MKPLLKKKNEQSTFLCMTHSQCDHSLATLEALASLPLDYSQAVKVFHLSWFRKGPNEILGISALKKTPVSWKYVSLWLNGATTSAVGLIPTPWPEICNTFRKK
ncbi:hypothetical protein DPMN_173218 [Dreissena polymorpha]|uniref:Uncharacterized protein n=1 Tax=Dreissena polymorpha TaxID=45954 RepID=A0A9D4IFW2_DREPO|nr:hypothetical protein DPMN_173218 [Dreissena polymorpha]